MQGSMEFSEPPPAKRSRALMRELHIGLATPETPQCPHCGISLVIYERPPRAVVRGIGAGSGEEYVTVNDIRFANASSFSIQQTNDRIRVTWNDQVLADGLVGQSQDGREYPYGLSFTWSGTEAERPGVKFTSLKVRGSPSSVESGLSPDGDNASYSR